MKESDARKVAALVGGLWDSGLIGGGTNAAWANRVSTVVKALLTGKVKKDALSAAKFIDRNIDEDSRVFVRLLNESGNRITQRR
jgi:hypothetical protein